MSRGPGHIQRAVLDALTGTGEWDGRPERAVSAVEVAHWSSDERYEWDTRPTPAQVEAARRALKALEARGLLESWPEANHDGPPWLTRWYRLTGPGGVPEGAW